MFHILPHVFRCFSPKFCPARGRDVAGAGGSAGAGGFAIAAVAAAAAMRGATATAGGVAGAAAQPRATQLGRTMGLIWINGGLMG